MASAEEYARWIVDNQDKRGTPEFDTVARAYQAARGQSAPETTKNTDLASQAGLALRAGVKGVAAIPAMMADAVTGPINWAQDKLLGEGQGYRFKQQLPMLDQALTSIGLPQPDTKLQRIVSKGVEVGTGAGAGAKLFGALGEALPESLSVSRNVLSGMASNPGTQISAGVGSGMAAEQSKEAGGGFGSQLVSSVLGGLMGAGAAAAAGKGANLVQSFLSPKTVPADLEARVMLSLEQQGIDPRSVTPAMKQALMNDVQQAMKTGEGTLNDAALARLADYRRLGLTPTRGRVTLDPLDVTREANAMKVAAATGADAQLPAIAQGNNRGLLNAVENFKPVNDPYATGAAAMSPVQRLDAALKAKTSSLYSQARDQSGRSAELDPYAFTSVANKALDEQLLGYAVPKDVANKLNQIAKGEVPFNVDYAEQLKTVLGNIGRADKGGATSKAMAVIRDALDQTPLRPAPQVNPGNLPAVPGTVPASPAALGSEAIDAFNAARLAHAQRMRWQESAPGIANALDGATAETFVQQNILSPSAGVKDVSALASVINKDQAAADSVRSAIVQKLKEAAIGKGNAADTGNFSGRQWNSALDSIGDRKLGLFFSPEEVATLRAVGRVGTYETFQPRGSAVNNSNTAAGVANLLQGVANYVKPLASKLPFGDAAVNAPLNNITLSLAERGARNVPAGLLNQAPVAPSSLLDSLLLPGLVTGGLLSQ